MAIATTAPTRIGTAALRQSDLWPGQWWLVRPLPQLLPRLLQRHRIGAGVTRLETRERAEQAARHADVGGLEPDVVVVESPMAVPALALAVGEPADGEQIRTVEQSDAFVEIEAQAGIELGGDIGQTGGFETLECRGM